MRKYHTLTKKQLVKWLSNFDDDMLISSFDDKGNTVTIIELSEYLIYDDDDYKATWTLSIKGR